MKTLTIQDIRNLKPCYDPNTHLPEDWSGTLIDILLMNKVPPQDRIWVASRLAPEREARLFAVACARKALKESGWSDERSLKACDVAERYANGEATKEELDAARSATKSAARSAAWSAAESAAYKEFCQMFVKILTPESIDTPNHEASTSMTKNEYLQFHRQCCDKMVEITKAKNSDYCGADNDDPFTNFRICERLGVCTVEQGFLTRMTDKLSRINSLLNTGAQQQVKDEAVEDTLLDLANYSILLRGYLESKKGNQHD